MGKYIGLGLLYLGMAVIVWRMRVALDKLPRARNVAREDHPPQDKQ